MRIFKKSGAKQSKKDIRVKKQKTVVNKEARNAVRKTGTGGFLRNMKIAPKILTGFLIISVLFAALGVFASMGLQTVSDSSKMQHDKILMPTKIAATISDSFNDELILIRQALLFENDNMIEGVLSSIKSDQMSISSSLSSIQSLIPPEKKNDYDIVCKAITDFNKLMIPAFNKIESGNKQAIIDDFVNYGELRRSEIDTQKAISNFEYALSQNALKLNTSNTATADMIMQIMTFSICGVLLLSILMGILLSRGISKPLKKLTENAKRLASGEIDSSISVRSSKDEVGQISEAFKTILKSIGELITDTDMLIEAATKGELSVRADAEKHQGAYRRIIEGINATLDATIEPMIESSKAVRELSEGNLNIEVTGEFSGDYAMYKEALNETIQTLKEYIHDVTYVLNEIAKGRLDVSVTSDYKGDFKALKESINQSLEAFNEVIKDIDTAAQEVASRTFQLSSGSQTISQGATEQAGAIEELTASLEDISKQTGYNAQRVNSANDLSREAKDGAIKGNLKMEQLQVAMKEINESSESISKIIKVIDDIAFQTNILALNAAVEAARAGSNGKGFAVVADEVRNLAAKSAKAAQDTSVLIENSIEKTKAGRKIADETASALTEIVSKIEKNVEISGEIAVASNEQATGLMQINKGIEQLSAVVQTNSALAQESAASTEELSGLADHLKVMVKRFTLKE